MLDWLLGKKIKIAKSEFEELGSPLADNLSEWQRHVVECSLNYPMPSMQAVNAIELGTRELPDDVLAKIGRLDDVLQLGGSLAADSRSLADLLKQFKASPDGPGFQRLGETVGKLNKRLDSLRKKHIA